MKKILSLFILSTTQVFAPLYANDVYFGGTLGLGSESITQNSWSGSSLWVDADKNPTSAVPTTSDNVYIDGEYITFNGGTNRLFASSINVNKLVIKNMNSGTTAKGFQLANTTQATWNFASIDYIRNAYSGDASLGISVTQGKQVAFNVAGDVNAGTASDPTGYKGILTFGAGGDHNWQGWGGPSSLKIGGNLNLYGTNCYFNVGIGSESGTTGNATIENPDILISGSLNMNAIGSTNPTVFLNQRGSGVSGGLRTKYILHTVVGVGGLSGNGVITNHTTNSTYKWGKGSATLVFNNSKSNGVYTFEGQINDDINKTAVAGTETVTKLVMKGDGTQILKGYFMKFSGGVEMHNGVLKLNYADSTNHGNLTMIGGNFSNTDDSTAKSVNFTKLIYNSGIIFSRWDGAQLDVINLSEGLFKGDIFSVNDKFIIGLVGDLESLINNEQKLFSWDNKTFITDFTEDDFALEDGYEGIFQIKDDGLYLQLTSVPEPAVIATVLGALALALAIRKRKF